MDRHGYDMCTPRRNDASVVPEPLIDFSSGYIRRAIDQFPRQGSKKPWRLYQNYVRDLVSLRFGAVNDPALDFARRREPAKAA
jgi:monooxygenase